MELKIRFEFVRFILLVYHMLENTDVEGGFRRDRLALTALWHDSKRAG